MTTWDPILIHIIGKKIDPDSKKEWELQLTTDELPELRTLMMFLDVRAKALENVGPTKKWGDKVQGVRGNGWCRPEVYHVQSPNTPDIPVHCI